MLKTRLNAEARGEIVKAAMSAAFDAEEARIKSDWDNVQNAALVLIYTPEVIKLLPKLPKVFVGTTNRLYIYATDEKHGNGHRFEVQFGKEVQVPSGHVSGYKPVDLTLDNPLVVAHKQYELDKQTLKSKRDQFRKDVIVRLNALSNYQQLFEAWPEVRELMGEEFWKPRVNTLPAISFTSIQEVIAAAQPAAA